MFFIGRTRYSQLLPETNSWHLSAGAKSIEAYREKLYDSARLKIREKLFTELTLPSLDAARQAAGIDLIHVVSYSESLPDAFKTGLEEAAQKFPFIVLDEQPDGHWGTSLDAIARQHVGDGEAFGRYRIDDDDVVAKSYFTTVSRYVSPEFAGMVVSLPLGIEAIYHEGKITFPRISHWPMYSLGLLDVCLFQGDDELVQPPSGAHNMADRRGPVILDSQSVSYVRLNHVDQDSGLRTGNAASLSDIMHSLSTYPPLTELEKFNEQFPLTASLLERETWVEVNSGKQRVVLPKKFKLPTPMQEVHVKIKHTFPRWAREKQAVVSLDLCDIEGGAVPLGRAISGIGNSRWKHIGHYCYMNTKPGRAVTNLDILLPEDVRLRGLKLIPFGRGGVPFSVDGVWIFTENSGTS